MTAHNPGMTLTAAPYKRSELSVLVKELLDGLGEAPDSVKQCFLVNRDVLPKLLVDVECEITDMTTATVILKPSRLLLELCAAIRTGNFNLEFIQQIHGFSFIDNGLVELPILSTLEEPPTGLDGAGG